MCPGHRPPKQLRGSGRPCPQPGAHPRPPHAHCPSVLSVFLGSMHQLVTSQPRCLVCGTGRPREPSSRRGSPAHAEGAQLTTLGARFCPACVSAFGVPASRHHALSACQHKAPCVPLWKEDGAPRICSVAFQGLTVGENACTQSLRGRPVISILRPGLSVSGVSLFLRVLRSW